MAEENTNPGGEGKTETPGKPTAPAPSAAPASSAPAPKPVPADSDTSTDSDPSHGETVTDASATPRPTLAKPGEGATGVIGGDETDAAAADAAEHITVAADPSGQVSNRVGGTLQREPTPEELPSDAKIAPVAEQVNPNAASQAVGAAPQPEEIAGVEQPKEGEKNVLSDTSDPTAFLPEDSEQHEEAQRAAEDAERDADRGRY